jgi:aminoglycoside phosphotransferase (APT) family kinase protein
VIGAPFFVMAYVDGLVLRNPDQAAAAFTPAQRWELGLRTVDVLAGLHDVDPDAVRGWDDVHGQVGGEQGIEDRPVGASDAHRVDAVGISSTSRCRPVLV